MAEPQAYIKTIIAQAKYYLKYVYESEFDIASILLEEVLWDAVKDTWKITLSFSNLAERKQGYIKQVWVTDLGVAFAMVNPDRY